MFAHVLFPTDFFAYSDAVLACLPDLKTAGLREVVLRCGIPFKETLALADETNASLIVLGSHGRSAVQEMLAGSTFENVARLSRQPVLVVRPQRSYIWKTR
jgi:nucleotide-binding universal stress UspA family protein